MGSSKVTQGEKISHYGSISQDEKLSGETSFLLVVAKFRHDQDLSFKELTRHFDLTKVVIDIVNAKGIGLQGYSSKKIIKQRVNEELDKVKELADKFVREVELHTRTLTGIVLDGMALAKVSRNLLEIYCNESLKKLTTVTEAFIEDLIDCERNVLWDRDGSNTDFDERRHHEDGDGNDDAYDVGNEDEEGKFTEDEKLQKAWEAVKLEIPDLEIKEIEETIENLPSYLAGKPEYALIYKQMKYTKMKVQTLVTKEDVILFYDKLIRYFKILSGSLSHVIPRITASNMIDKYRKTLENHLLKYKDKVVEQLKKDHSADPIDQERRRLEERIVRYEAAKEAITLFRLIPT